MPEKIFKFRHASVLGFLPEYLPAPTKPLWSAFGKFETELAAFQIFELCKSSNSWEFHQQDLPRPFSWQGLWWEFIRPLEAINALEQRPPDPHETLVVSAEFVARCWLALL